MGGFIADPDNAHMYILSSMRFVMGGEEGERVILYMAGDVGGDGWV